MSSCGYTISPNSLRDKNFLNTQEKRKKPPIWELFFDFPVCSENSYHSRNLAILFIHMTKQIIFISKFSINNIKRSIFIILIWCKKCCDHRFWYAKISSHMGVFFCFYCVSRKYLYFKVIGDNIYPEHWVYYFYY